jgi:nucleotide-binding universal stress UspA family protein
MRAVLWIAEGTWETCVRAAAALLPDQAAITLVHVADPDAEAVASGAHTGLLGRRSPRHSAPELDTLVREEAEALLALARERLGREAEMVARRGRPERELIEAARGADVLILARDGRAPTGPRSVGPGARFVLDHAPCPVLLVPGTDGPPPPPGPPERRGSRGWRPGDPPLPSQER